MLILNEIIKANKYSVFGTMKFSCNNLKDFQDLLTQYLLTQYAKTIQFQAAPKHLVDLSVITFFLVNEFTSKANSIDCFVSPHPTFPIFLGRQRKNQNKKNQQQQQIKNKTKTKYH